MWKPQPQAAAGRGARRGPGETNREARKVRRALARTLWPRRSPASRRGSRMAARVKKIEDQPLPLGTTSVRVAEKSEDAIFPGRISCSISPARLKRSPKPRSARRRPIRCAPFRVFGARNSIDRLSSARPRVKRRARHSPRSPLDSRFRGNERSLARNDKHALIHQPTNRNDTMYQPNLAARACQVVTSRCRAPCRTTTPRSPAPAASSERSRRRTPIRCPAIRSPRARFRNRRRRPRG